MLLWISTAAACRFHLAQKRQAPISAIYVTAKMAKRKNAEEKKKKKKKEK